MFSCVLHFTHPVTAWFSPLQKIYNSNIIATLLQHYRMTNKSSFIYLKKNNNNYTNCCVHSILIVQSLSPVTKVVVKNK